MAIDLDVAAEQYLRELRLHLAADDLALIVKLAEALARSASIAPVVTRGHLRAAERQFWETHTRPLGPSAKVDDFIVGRRGHRLWFGVVKAITAKHVVCLLSQDGSEVRVPDDVLAYRRYGEGGRWAWVVPEESRWANRL